MIAPKAKVIEAHHANLRRYCQILAAELTDLEREFLHRRIAETQKAIERLEAPDEDIQLSRGPACVRAA